MNTISADKFYGGGLAALAGGTTTVLDFVVPNIGEVLPHHSLLLSPLMFR